MDPKNMPPLDAARQIAAMGPRAPKDRARFKYGVLGVALLGALAAGTAINSADEPAARHQVQAQVVAKFMLHHGAALPGQSANAWQQPSAQDEQALHNIVLEHEGRLAVVSVSPEMFNSVCPSISEDLAMQFDGGLGCGTRYGADGNPIVEVAALDTMDVVYSPSDDGKMTIHELQGVTPMAQGWSDRLKLRRDLAKASKSGPSI